MKPSLLFLMLGISLVSFGQSSLNTVINEDGKTLSILIEGKRNGKPINYDRKFDVTKLSSSEKEALKNRVLDSLGLGQPTANSEAVVERDRSTANGVGTSVSSRTSGRVVVSTPKPPTPPGPPADAGQTVVTFQCESCAGKVKLEISSALEDFAIERDAKAGTDKRMFPYQVPLTPGEYHLKYYQNGVLQMQSIFSVKADESNEVMIK
ncbi:hypothetical protein WBJ53_06160 [Spirosoma sp. SC4-14]|uniref:hypothetical protein n=1 Tax=Spirosoma sp. SC4-14 TaxID=3128900 RepID=UPI0030D51EFE